MDPERPKVKRDEVQKVMRKAGIRFSPDRPDFAIVIGGDGVFGYYGRSESVPLLFVGVRSVHATGSKAFLAEIYFDELEKALVAIRDGRYSVVAHKRLEVSRSRRRLGEVFTDMYLQRGAESNSIRYRVEVSGGRSIVESAIGDGVVVCTHAGSTGYYSYPDKIRAGDWLESERYSMIGEDEIGICHIVPTFTSREGSSVQPLRYTIPWQSRVTVKLVREADARVYGVTGDRSGVRVGVRDVITVRPSRGTTQLIKVESPLSKKR